MYEVSRWIEGNAACENGCWRLFARRKTKRGTVRQIRALEARGYDRHASIYVERKEGA